MKFSYNWLKEYVEFEETPAQLSLKLTEAGFEVEEYFPLIKKFSGVIVGRVESVEQHPNADRLTVCRVNTGTDTYQVICGAPNVAGGQIVPFAQIGAELPNGFKLKKTKIRGVESLGMICSKAELGLEKSSEGIWVFDEPLELNRDLYEILSQNQDYVFDLSITPNRPDCLSIIGIAREVAAITGNELKWPEVNISEDNAQKVEDFITIEIDDPVGCPRYAGRVIKDIELGPGPAWMQRKLEAVGIRPINNIVDITNYVLMEFGHPLHAFDLDRIAGNKIIVRSSQDGEKFVTLDQKERQLPPETVMICDAKRPVAIGGVMGGLNSEVTETTKDILLESAYFNPQRISVSGKRMGLSTEAAQRFERGADPNGVLRAMNRASALITSLAGGKVVKGVCDVYPNPVEPKKIKLRASRVNHVLGSDLDEKTIFDKLAAIELKSENGMVTAPTFRVDLNAEIDLIEEVARLVNYSNLPTKKDTTLLYEIDQPPAEARINFFRESMIALGMYETINNSMMKTEDAQKFSENAPVKIMNPISDDMTAMRTSLLPGLLKSLAYNLNRNMNDLRFFEIGRIFKAAEAGKLPDQPNQIAGIITGRRFQESWDSIPESVDFYDIKGILETFLEKIFLDNFHFILYDKSKYFVKNETVAVKSGDEIIGLCGRIEEEIADYFEIQKPVFAFELDDEKLKDLLNFERRYKPIPRYPYSERDIAFVMDSRIAAADVLKYIRSVSGPLLDSLEVFDVYEGKNIPPGKRSLAVRLHFQSNERTLNDDEVDTIFKKIIETTSKKFNAGLRQ